ncbi:hypothetical protein BWI93_14920 [Siphonobacter sp. BAB-5385]|uniref:hypothetical protein n=1 Tax=Siphonobacter sp. BAB-5385 TaxID=1864822 RepID=UPI000B9E2BDA|nr:hypothetical protein [Siphonobacter sp. BAB-5385]OZI07324.1 hypothetical protein BWI93_14920 [Siphonobacter sp. BAB-5385]
MQTKPITPNQHGTIDYAFSVIQTVTPTLLELPKPTQHVYQILGLSFLTVNALTDTDVAAKPVLTFKQHQRGDAAFLAGLALLTLSRPIRTHKRTLAFHLGFLALAVTHYVLTDYDSGSGS